MGSAEINPNMQFLISHTLRGGEGRHRENKFYRMSFIGQKKSGKALGL